MAVSTEEINQGAADCLSVIAELARMQAAGIAESPRLMNRDEVRLMLEEFGERVAAVGRLHGMLANARQGTAIDLAVYFRDVSTSVVSSSAVAEKTKLLFSTEPGCLVSPPSAQALGLILGELATNAVKYAHPTGIAGKIEVGCRKESTGTIVVEVCDDGVGLPDGFDPMKSGGLGLRLIRSLADQIEAKIDFVTGVLGLTFVLRLPAGRAA
jgi:two-component sensor histidine kinase